MTLLTALRMLPGVIILALVLALAVTDRRADKWEAQAGKLSAELKRISSEKNEQKVVTRDRIVIADKGRKQAEDKAKVIEAAPLPGNCKTPSEVLQADL